MTSRDAESAPPLEIQRIQSPRALRVKGEVDLSNVAALGQAVNQEIDETGSVTLDLAGCSYIGSEGIGVLIEAWNRVKDGGRIVLRSPTGMVRRVLELAGIERFPGVEVVQEESP
jgi:anti-anti-sigma factor